LRYVRTYQKDNNHSCEKGEQVANYFGHGCISYSAAEEQARANRRSAEPDAQIHNHNYAKMQGMYAEVPDYG